MPRCATVPACGSGRGAQLLTCSLETTPVLLGIQTQKINTLNQSVCPQSLEVNALGCCHAGNGTDGFSSQKCWFWAHETLFSTHGTKQSSFQSPLGNSGRILAIFLYPVPMEEIVKFTTGAEQAKEKCFGKSHHGFQAGRAFLPTGDPCQAAGTNILPL